MIRYLRFLYFFPLVLLFSCNASLLGPATEDALATGSEEPCGFVQNSYGQRVSWAGRSPVLFYIDRSVPLAWDSALIEAARIWENAIGSQVILFQRGPATEDLPVGLDNKNVIVAKSVWDSTPTQQALTLVYWKGNIILNSDIKINWQYFDYDVDSSLAAGKVHLASLMVHEFGHALGLLHNQSLPTVMWPTLATATERMILSSLDKGNIECEY